MPRRQHSPIYTAEMGQPPKDIDMGSVKPRPVNKAGTKMPVSPAAKRMVDDSMRHYKGKK